jgi:hypothetical protein
VFKHLKIRRVVEIEDDNGIAAITTIARAHSVWTGVKLNEGEDSNAFRKRVSSESVSAAAAAEISESSANKPMFLSAAAVAPANANTIIGIGSLSKSALSAGGKINVVELYKPPRSYLLGVFAGSSGELAENVYRASEVRTLLSQYIAANSFESAENKACVVIPSTSDLYPIVAKNIKTAKPVNIDNATNPQANDSSMNSKHDIYAEIEELEAEQFKNFVLDHGVSSPSEQPVNYDKLDAAVISGNEDFKDPSDIMEEFSVSKEAGRECGAVGEQPESDSTNSSSAAAVNQTAGYRFGNSSGICNNTAQQTISTHRTAADPWKRASTAPFKPISLPSAGAGKAAKNSSVHGKSGSISNNASSGSTGNTKASKPQISKPAAVVAEKYDLMVKRDELLLSILQGMTKYHGIEREGN